MFLGSLAFRIASADAYKRTRETIGAITGYLQESLSGVRVVRSFAQEGRHRGQFAALNADNQAANLTTVKLNAAYFPPWSSSARSPPCWCSSTGATGSSTGTG
jgi:ATP-binding cassette subfamily B protein